ncbi:MAG: allophanate hydrolase subunit 2 family protein, partial [Gordonia sp. (in: high G+C Gram-positive bacteria)]
VGTAARRWPVVQHAPRRASAGGATVLTADDGPRADRLVDPDALYTGTWTVNPASNRVGVRLDRVEGPALAHQARLPELPSEGIAHGSIQVPPGGQPVLFGPDHPVTGGYPVVAVLTADSLDAAGQLSPGTTVVLRRRAAPADGPLTLP